jgi:hypothetical protein
MLTARTAAHEIVPRVIDGLTRLEAAHASYASTQPGMCSGAHSAPIHADPGLAGRA